MCSRFDVRIVLLIFGAQPESLDIQHLHGGLVNSGRDARGCGILLAVSIALVPFFSFYMNFVSFASMGAWVDLSLMFLTFTFSMIWNVEVGVVVSLIISLLLVVHRSSKARLTILVSDFLVSNLEILNRFLVVGRVVFRELIDGNQ